MGKRSHEVEIVVQAPSSNVWAILSDVTAWPSWTPTVTRVHPLGNPRLETGAKFEVRQPGVPKASFTVDHYVEGRSFRWTSQTLGIKSVADHVITDDGLNRSKVTLTFEMEGRAAVIAWLLSGGKVRRFVNLEAQSLKAAAEAREVIAGFS